MDFNDVASFPALLPESSQGYHKAKPGIATRNDLLEREGWIFAPIRRETFGDRLRSG
jgi:hypothetical protein